MSTDRIAACFARCRQENRKALITYFTAGYPTIADCETVIDTAIAAGADIIELGIPFSDPTADGTVIQAAGQKALTAGVRFRDILALARRLREKHPETPLILFGYYNIFFQYGLEKLARECYSIMDGFLIVDLPLEEREEVKPTCDRFDIALIPLVAPTTGLDRAREIMADCRGFVYCVTVCGVTGARGSLPPELAERMRALKQLTSLPLAAGFGIADGTTARMAGQCADAAIVGSALVQRSDNPNEVEKLVKELKQALEE